MVQVKHQYMSLSILMNIDLKKSLVKSMNFTSDFFYIDLCKIYWSCKLDTSKVPDIVTMLIIDCSGVMFAARREETIVS